MTGVLAPTQAGIRVAIDRGGTFCDVWAYVPSHLYRPATSPELLGNASIIPSHDDSGSVQITLKLLSVDPANYDDAPSEGIRRLLQIVTGREIPRGDLYDTSLIESVRMGTTVATNALLERKGADFGLVVTRGHKDFFEIGDQTRPDLFDLSISRKAKVLYRPENIVEANERVTMEGWSLNPEPLSTEALLAAAKESDEPGEVVLGVSGEAVRILEPLDVAKVEKDLQQMYDRGLRSLAVCLLHSYTYPEHERQIGDIAARIGFTQISLSHALSPAIKAVPRGNSAALDAYLSPVLRSYVDGFNRHFVGGRAGKRSDFMKSDGGLSSSDKFSGLRAVLSGPAGGFVGCALTAYSPTRDRPVIGFDMGGTSTDVCRFSGDFELTFESVIASIKIACPQLSIDTVAAGGGSRLSFKNGMFVVGPESVGAHPGPACYRKGGDLAITDANLVLGRLVPSQFPSIFGPNADEPLDVSASVRKFEQLTNEINATETATPYTVQEVAAGFLRVANEGMSRPMRKLTEERGFAISTHDLCCFGGAGGQHACAIASGLGIETVIVPRFSSLLSAYGIACAELTGEAAAPMALEVVDHLESSPAYPGIEKRLEELREDVTNQLVDQGVARKDITFSVSVNVLYDGADSIFHLPLSDDLKQNFIATHQRETSFTLKRRVLLSGLRVQGSGKSFKMTPSDFADELAEVESAGRFVESKPDSTQEAFFDVSGRVTKFTTPVYILDKLPQGVTIPGPALVVDSTQTIVVEPNALALILREHVALKIAKASSATVDDANEFIKDPIMLAVFANRFMSIAEQMGHTLQRTSISVSIKERLDFSCSIHGTDGALVANAPHIPIHLGSMQYAVMAQHKHWEGKLRPGDVLLTNHPLWGGTHLPDLTVISPIFGPDDDTKVLFYVASRGHHTDIGGTAVTSMNPSSRELWEEGMRCPTFKLVSQGHFDEEGVVKLFMEAADYPGSSATRRIDHNLTDLQAAVSANARGARLVDQLFQEFGTRYVLFYMKEIQLVAQETVKSFFRELYDKTGGKPLRASDYMDEGTEIVLEVRIDREEGTATFDWTGTGPQVHGNSNMPPSLTHAAIIYSLRSMINPSIPMPLNQGVMDPVKIVSPKGSIINPCGVVAISASTISTQRLIDVILRTFGAAACSQGCASSIGFGTGGKDAYGNVTPGFTFGESLGGGTGAGPTWDGQHCTHVHCTNTRLTDLEVIEHRTPLLITEMFIRKGSGGSGKHRGGCGMDKTFEARRDLNCSIVSQRRVFPPLGLAGGGNGARGENIWMRKTEDGGFDIINMGHNGLVKMRKGDRVTIRTPGAGGWGVAE
ncbi:5-oxoprolinase [Naematelia encephala]|uniref:5-oxoprolinase n=1 Tax=Naematelia encephala TaxID=71784 RepID=A0A1Y2B3B4_9TREE|nr:5-oxoprolinase [Naematelia encephala]